MAFIVLHEFDFFETKREFEKEQLQLFIKEFDEFWEQNIVPGDLQTSILKYKPTKKEERLVVLRDVHSAGAIIGMFLLSYVEEIFFVERFAVMETENIELFVRNFVSRKMHPVLRINKNELYAYLKKKDEFGLQGFTTKPEKEGEYFIFTLNNPCIISGMCYIANLSPPEHKTSLSLQKTNVNLSPRAEPKNNSPFPTATSGVKSSDRKLLHVAGVFGNSSSSATNDASTNSSIVDENNIDVVGETHIGKNDKNVNNELFKEADTPLIRKRSVGRPRGESNKKKRSVAE